MNYKEYYDLIKPTYITWEFYNKYTTLEPPFSKVGRLVYLRTYSRFIELLKRREKWCEICLRVVEYSLSLDTVSSFHDKQQEAESLFDNLFNLVSYVAGRTYWIGGTEQTTKDASANWNCVYRNLDNLSAFTELFYWLLIGAGTGFSVEKKYISQLPKLYPNKLITHLDYIELENKLEPTTVEITTLNYHKVKLTLDKTHLIDTDKNFNHLITSQSSTINKAIINIGDSKEGWCNALRLYFHLLTLPYLFEIQFNYNNIRSKGKRIKTFGGRASGHGNIKRCIELINDELTSTDGVFTSVIALTIMCIIGDTVVSGGVRRTAEDGLGDKDDIEFIEAKYGMYDDNKPELIKYRNIRDKSNNSVMYYERPSYEELEFVINRARYNGEPGLCIIGNAQKFDSDISGFNPCFESALHSKQSCNLTTNNLRACVVESDGKYTLDLNKWYKSLYLTTRVASRQTTATQWHPEWDKVQKQQRLLGVSITGLIDTVDVLGWSNEQLAAFLDTSKNYVRKVADEYHDALGIERSARVTLIKPEGCYDIKHLRTTDKGLLRVDEIGDVSQLGFKPIELDINTSNGDKITQTYNNGLSDVVEIELNNGRKFKCTLQHPISVKGTWKNAVNLQIGDVLDTELGTYNKNTNEVLTQHQIKYNHLQQNNISFPCLVDEDLAWWVAAFFGNGSVQADRGYFDFCSQHIEVMQRYVETTKRLFNIQVNVERHKTKNMYCCRIRSVDLVQFLTINGLLKTKTFDVPLVFRKSSKSVLLSFVCGYLDTDGCFKNNTCTITTKNIKFARLFQEVTEAIGLSFSCYEYTRTTTKGVGTYCDLQLSRTYSTSNSIDYINNHSVKAAIKSPILKSDKSHKHPYKVKSITLLDEMINTYDVEVDTSHWYYQGGIKSHNSLSKLTGVSEGVHRAYAPHYINRIRFSSNDPLAKVLFNEGVPVSPENGQGNDLFAPNCDRWVFTFAVKSDTKRRYIDESAIAQLERYKLVQQHWVDGGHNCSITVSVDPHEWGDVTRWVYDNWEYVIAVSFLERFDPTECINTVYPNIPKETCTYRKYQEVDALLPDFKEDELLAKVAEFEQEDDEYSLDSSCDSGFCPTR